MISKLDPDRPARRQKSGGRTQGTPNKVTAEIRVLAQQYSERALAELARLMEQGSNEQVRLAACRELLNRAHGKPTQAVSINETVHQPDSPAIEFTEEQRKIGFAMLDALVNPPKVEQ